MSAKPNAELAYRILDRIDADPRSWRQDVWDCGTAACFAGWAVRLSGGTSSDDLVTEGPAELVGRAVGAAAHTVLGIDEDTAWSLFDRGTGDWLFSPDLDREGLGRTVAEIFGPRPARPAVDSGGCPPGGCIPNFCVGADDCRREYDSNGDVIYDEDDLPPNAGSAS